MNKFIEKFIDQVRSMYPDDFIPLHRPVFNGNEKILLKECIDSNFVSSAGKMIIDFEHKIADYSGMKYAISTVNGTSALHIALLLGGVKRNTEVITQALTFVATGNAISYCGAKPIFLDVDIDTMGLSPTSLKKFLKENTELEDDKLINKNTGNVISACVPMHTFGNPCRIDEISKICKKFNINLIEDAAESLGSFYKGKHTGSFGLASCISFNGNKIITTGGGGMILTNNQEFADKAKHITTTAKVPHQFEYIHDQVGYNYRMPNLNAALGIAQINQIDYFLNEKKRISEIYKDFFNDFSNVEFYLPIKNSDVNSWLNAIIFSDKKQKDDFLKVTNSKNIMTRPIWRLLSDLEMFKEAENDGLHNSKWLMERVVNIPSSVP